MRFIVLVLVLVLGCSPMMHYYTKVGCLAPMQKLVASSQILNTEINLNAALLQSQTDNDKNLGGRMI